MKIDKKEYEYLEQARKIIKKEFETIKTFKEFQNFKNKYKDYPFIDNYLIDFTIGDYQVPEIDIPLPSCEEINIIL